MYTNAKSTPFGNTLLQKDLYRKQRKEAWNYQTAVGMLHYLQGNTHKKISMAVHQTKRF